jgi:hypothetical protein
MKTFNNYSAIWLVDFEYSTNGNFLPVIICMVAKEIISGSSVAFHGDDLLSEPSFLKDTNALYVCFYAVAEMSCHLQLGWQLPDKLIDLFVEFRILTNGLPLPFGRGLLGALSYFGISAMGAEEKKSMRDLAIRGAPYSNNEMESLIDYCKEDVLMTEKLFLKMSHLLLCQNQMLYRGEYMKCVARMEQVGVPLDYNFLNHLKFNFENIKLKLINKIDEKYGVYDETTFKQSLFEKYLIANSIPWPRLESGKLSLDDDTFKQMAISHPQLNELRELKTTLSQTKLNKINIGLDGKNRTMLSPFSSITGRNQPSTSSFIYGPSAWIRSAIKPAEGMAVAYIDWSQQEFGIAAALSDDKNMIESYLSGDPYLSFAKLAGAVPENATKKSHPEEREKYKACVLAVQYGMGAASLASRINKSPAFAEELLEKHRTVFRNFWKWSHGCLDYAYLMGNLTTTLGWKFHLGMESNPRSLSNFPMQANGSEILRIAIILCFEKGIQVCAPIHDAILIESTLENIDRDILIAQKCMEDASALILNGFKLRSDVEVYKYPDHYSDKRGIKMWKTINDLLRDVSPVS